MDAQTPETTRWHLDRKVPISIIFAIMAQFVGGLWFISKLDARVVALEALNAAQTTSQRDRDLAQDRQVTEAIQLVRSQLERMDDKLDRIIERPRKQ